VARRLTCVVTNRFQEERAAVASIPQQPQPEIEALARPAGRSPRASDEREVQEKNGIRSPKSDFDGIIGSQVTV